MIKICHGTSYTTAAVIVYISTESMYSFFRTPTAKQTFMVFITIFLQPVKLHTPNTIAIEQLSLNVKDYLKVIATQHNTGADGKI